MKNSTTVWRVQLKPDKNGSITYRDLLQYCMEQHIIGVGWQEVQIKGMDDNELRNACKVYDDGQTGATSAYRAIHAMSQMKTGDLIWTRVGEDASDYYLCRVGEKLWKDRNVSAEDQRRYDISNVVSADWVYVGKQEKVPGKIVNSFAPPASAQRVNNVERSSMSIWNQCSSSDAIKYSCEDLSIDDFWTMIGSEELECLVLLYIQTLGYYIYSSTAKLSNPKYEAIMVAKDGSHFAYPQVKRETQLLPEVYADGITGKDVVFLFTTSEDYGKTVMPNVICITKNDLEKFIQSQFDIQTTEVKNLYSFVHQK